MSDTFTNARPYFDVTFPSSGDSFSISNFRNVFQGLGFMDMIPLQPRAHSPANTSIFVRGRDASSFYNPVYAGDADQHVFFSSGDSPTFSAPVSNPRIDIVYLTPSGDLRIVQGTEAAAPTLPSLSPSGDTRLPICAVYNLVGQSKIVNFEDKDSNTGDGYIYQDLRPFLRVSAMGGTTLTSLTPVSATGDNSVGTGTTAARADHVHEGVRGLIIPGTGDGLGNTFQRIDGEIQLEGAVVNPSGNNNRFIISGAVSGSYKNLKIVRSSAIQVVITFDELVVNDINNRSYKIFNKSISLAITSSGVGGLIAGSTEEASKWYYIYILANTANGTINGILSPSSTSITIPSGYNAATLISAVFNDSSSDFIDFIQDGNYYEYVTWRIAASGNVGTNPSVSVDTTSFVPSTLSTVIFGSLYNDGNVTGIGNKSSVIADNTDGTNKIGFSGTGNATSVRPWRMHILTANTLWWGSNTANQKLYIGGFEINKL